MIGMSGEGGGNKLMHVCAAYVVAKDIVVLAVEWSKTQTEWVWNWREEKGCVSASYQKIISQSKL